MISTKICVLAQMPIYSATKTSYNFKIWDIAAHVKCVDFFNITHFLVNFTFHSLFCLFDSLRPINNLSVIKGRVFLD